MWSAKKIQERFHYDAAKGNAYSAEQIAEATGASKPSVTPDAVKSVTTSDDTLAMGGLSWVYLALGRNADALRLSKQSADSMPTEKDAVSGPSFQTGLAQIEARAGAPHEAIKTLRHLLSIPAGDEVSIGRLKSDPVWDPIRNRPDFQQLLLGPEQIGPNK